MADSSGRGRGRGRAGPFTPQRCHGLGGGGRGSGDRGGLVLATPVHVRQLLEPGPPVVQVVVVLVPGAGRVQGADRAGRGAAPLVVEDQQGVVGGRRGVVVCRPESLGPQRHRVRVGLGDRDSPLLGPGIRSAQGVLGVSWRDVSEPSRAMRSHSGLGGAANSVPRGHTSSGGGVGGRGESSAPPRGHVALGPRFWSRGQQT